VCVQRLRIRKCAYVNAREREGEIERERNCVCVKESGINFTVIEGLFTQR